MLANISAGRSHSFQPFPRSYVLVEKVDQLNQVKTVFCQWNMKYPNQPNQKRLIPSTRPWLAAITAQATQAHNTNSKRCGGTLWTVNNILDFICMQLPRVFSKDVKLIMIMLSIIISALLTTSASCFHSIRLP